MERRSATLLLLLLLMLAVLSPGGTGTGLPVREARAAQPVCSGWSSDACFRDEGTGILACWQHCIHPSPPGGGWAWVVYYLEESGCSGKKCSSSWRPNDEQALYEYVSHRLWLWRNCPPSNPFCPGYPGDPGLYSPPSTCNACSVFDPRDRCTNVQPPFAPRGTWHHTRLLRSTWVAQAEPPTIGCAGHPEAECTTIHWYEEWPGADPNGGSWSFAEEDQCRGQPTPPGGGDPGEPTPTPPPGCIPGTCRPRCTFPKLRVNGELLSEDPPGPAFKEGPLTISFNAPRPGGCDKGWHNVHLRFYANPGEPAVVSVNAVYNADLCGDLNPIRVEWSDGTSGCEDIGAEQTKHFHHLPPGDYYVQGLIQRRQCGVGFSTNCTWYLSVGEQTPTQTASLEARVEYYSDHDNDSSRGPDNPYRTSRPFLLWNYGEFLHSHPTAEWEEPTFPGWKATTEILRWKYLGSTTETGWHEARCLDLASCDWQRDRPRTYIHLRWYKHLMPGEVEGEASEPLKWVYATQPGTVNFAYEVQAQTVWIPQDGGPQVTLPFSETMTMTVELKYVSTHRGK